MTDVKIKQRTVDDSTIELRALQITWAKTRRREDPEDPESPIVKVTQVEVTAELLDGNRATTSYWTLADKLPQQCQDAINALKAELLPLARTAIYTSS